MRPIPWKVEPLPTLWMNPATGYAVDTNGRKISPVIRGRRKRPILEDILNTAQVTGIKRIVLVGSIPGRERNGDHWFQQIDSPDWAQGRHWLGSSSSPVGRYFHKTQNRENPREKPFEVSLASAWFGDVRLSHEQAREAWELTQNAVVRAEESLQGLMKSPATTGLQLWAQSLPRNLEPAILEDDIAEEIHATSGQHHMEHLVAGPGYVEHELCVPLMHQVRGEAMPEFSYIDGRFMYAACGYNLGVGPAQRMRGKDAEDLWLSEDHRFRRVGQFVPARYLVRVRVPEDWRSLGILPIKHTLENGALTWVYPNRPGAVFDAWAGNEELRVVEEFGWRIERFHEAIVFQDKRPALRGEARAVEARPLDTFCKRLVNAREAVSSLGENQGYAPAVVDAASGAIRQMMLQAIGAFNSRGNVSTITVDSAWDVPEQYAHSMRQVGDKFVYEEPAPLRDRQRPFYHPELSSQVWSRARARVLHGPMAQGQKRGALHVDPSTLIGINGDALYTTTLPSWCLPVEKGGLDDGAVGRLRLKGYLPAGSPEMALPTTVEARLRLARRAEAYGVEVAAASEALEVSHG